MDVDFDNSNLKELFETGKNRKYKIQEEIKKNFLKKVRNLQKATTIYHIMQDKSNHFEKLQGRENEYSMRVNDQYRLELRIDWEDKSRNIVKKIWVIELSKHYR